jgi:hypothetical protein
LVDLEGQSGGKEEASVEGYWQDGHKTVPKGDTVEWFTIEVRKITLR